MADIPPVTGLPGADRTRIHAEDMTARIASVAYLRPPESTLTLCVIALDNGFTTTGESACVDPANFDQALGERLAYDAAFRKLWPLFGFLAREDRFRAAAVAV